MKNIELSNFLTDDGNTINFDKFTQTTTQIQFVIITQCEYNNSFELVEWFINNTTHLDYKLDKDRINFIINFICEINDNFLKVFPITMIVNIMGFVEDKTKFYHRFLTHLASDEKMELVLNFPHIEIEIKNCELDEINKNTQYAMDLLELINVPHLSRILDVNYLFQILNKRNNFNMIIFINITNLEKLSHDNLIKCIVLNPLDTTNEKNSKSIDLLSKINPIFIGYKDNNINIVKYFDFTEDEIVSKFHHKIYNGGLSDLIILNLIRLKEYDKLSVFLSTNMHNIDLFEARIVEGKYPREVVLYNTLLQEQCAKRNITVSRI